VRCCAQAGVVEGLMRLMRRKRPRALARRQSLIQPFRFRDASVAGTGLQSDLQGTDWERIRDLAYQG